MTPPNAFRHSRRCPLNRIWYQVSQCRSLLLWNNASSDSPNNSPHRLPRQQPPRLHTICGMLLLREALFPSKIALWKDCANSHAGSIRSKRFQDSCPYSQGWPEWWRCDGIPISIVTVGTVCITGPWDPRRGHPCVSVIPGSLDTGHHVPDIYVCLSTDGKRIRKALGRRWVQVPVVGLRPAY